MPARPRPIRLILVTETPPRKRRDPWPSAIRGRALPVRRLCGSESASKVPMRCARDVCPSRELMGAFRRRVIIQHRRAPETSASSIGGREPTQSNLARPPEPEGRPRVVDADETQGSHVEFLSDRPDGVAIHVQPGIPGALAEEYPDRGGGAQSGDRRRHPALRVRRVCARTGTPAGLQRAFRMRHPLGRPRDSTIPGTRLMTAIVVPGLTRAFCATVLSATAHLL